MGQRLVGGGGGGDVLLGVSGVAGGGEGVDQCGDVDEPFAVAVEHRCIRAAVADVTATSAGARVGVSVLMWFSFVVGRSTADAVIVASSLRGAGVVAKVRVAPHLRLVCHCRAESLAAVAVRVVAHQ